MDLRHKALNRMKALQTYPCCGQYPLNSKVPRSVIAEPVEGPWAKAYSGLRSHHGNLPQSLQKNSSTPLYMLALKNQSLFVQISGSSSLLRIADSCNRSLACLDVGFRNNSDKILGVCDSHTQRKPWMPAKFKISGSGLGPRDCVVHPSRIDPKP